MNCVGSDGGEVRYLTYYHEVLATIDNDQFKSRSTKLTIQKKLGLFFYNE